MLRRLTVMLIVLLLGLSAIPAYASPDRERPDNSREQGRTKVQLNDFTFDDSVRAETLRSRDGSIRLEVLAVSGEGDSECPRGRCREYDDRSAQVHFSPFQLDLQQTGRTREGNVYEARGRVDGRISWDLNGNERFDSRWHGNVTAQATVVQIGRNEYDITFDDLIINGIVIDIPSAGIVIPITQIAIDHVGAG